MKTGIWLIGLLLVSWTLEIVGGLQIIAWGWNAPLPGGSMASLVAQIGNALASYVAAFPHVPRTIRYLWTPAAITMFLTSLYLWFHLVWAALSLMWPMLERLRLGARRPNEQERRQAEAALSALTRNNDDIACPRRWLVADGPGLRIRWLGYVLIIDRPLLQHRFLMPLLAHELGHTNQEDRIARRLYAMLPERRALILALLGLPAGMATVLLYPAWAAYWRARIYAADAYAAKLGQGYALIKALHDLYLPLDRVTRFGRWVRPVPYVGSRIGRIERLLSRENGVV